MESLVAISGKPSEHWPKCHEEFGTHFAMTHMNEQVMTRRRRNFCIDDNCDVLQIEKSMLENAGYEVVVSSDGPARLTIANGGKVDLVVLDCEMPQMNGIEVAQRIRAIKPTVPIVMVSGADLAEEPARIVDCFVPKTLMVATLVEEVNRLLGGGAGLARQ